MRSVERSGPPRSPKRIWITTRRCRGALPRRLSSQLRLSSVGRRPLEPRRSPHQRYWDRRRWLSLTTHPPRWVWNTSCPRHARVLGRSRRRALHIHSVALRVRIGNRRLGSSRAGMSSGRATRPDQALSRAEGRRRMPSGVRQGRLSVSSAASLANRAGSPLLFLPPCRSWSLCIVRRLLRWRVRQRRAQRRSRCGANGNPRRQRAAA